MTVVLKVHDIKFVELKWLSNQCSVYFHFTSFGTMNVDSIVE
jgi:hypothetical protein